MRNYYEMLGLKKSATEKEIKSSYRKLARKYHPDVNPGDQTSESRFKEITEAYEVLSDKQKRSQYDQVGHKAWKAGFKEGQGPWQSSGRSSRSSSSPFSGFGFDGVRFSNMGGGMGEIDFDDLLGGMFSGAGRRTRRGPARGEDSLAKLAIPMEDAVVGGEKRITITTGSGHQESLTVSVPKGISEGQKIRLSGKGQPGFQGGPSGDLLIEILYEPDMRFSREEENLIYEAKIPFTLACLGGEISVPTLEGAVKLTIPESTQGGQKLRLTGKGLPKKGGGRGDQFVRIRIAVPRNMDAKARQLVEQLKQYE